MYSPLSIFWHSAPSMNSSSAQRPFPVTPFPWLPTDHYPINALLSLDLSILALIFHFSLFRSPFVSLRAVWGAEAKVGHPIKMVVGHPDHQKAQWHPGGKQQTSLSAEVNNISWQSGHTVLYPKFGCNMVWPLCQEMLFQKLLGWTHCWLTSHHPCSALLG